MNYRLSELHAAIGLAQTRKVPQIITANQKNKKILTDILSKNKFVSFATIADPVGDSATFLNLLLPDTASAKLVVDELNKQGIGGFNYWFTNMYHFINQWKHLQQLKTVSKLAVEVLGAPQDYQHLSLPKTQEVIGKLISFGIRCTWTEDEVKDLANKISDTVNKVLGK